MTKIQNYEGIDTYTVYLNMNEYNFNCNYYVLNTYDLPATGLSALQTLAHSILTTAPMW